MPSLSASKCVAYVFNQDLDSCGKAHYLLCESYVIYVGEPVGDGQERFYHDRICEDNRAGDKCWVCEKALCTLSIPYMAPRHIQLQIATGWRMLESKHDPHNKCFLTIPLQEFNEI